MVTGALSRGWRSIPVIVLCLWFAAPASAQTGPTDAPGSAVASVSDRTGACVYDACALRLWDGELLEGREQEAIGHFGFVRPPRMRSLLAASDSAAAHFLEVEENYTQGRLTVLAARLFSVAGIVMSFSEDSGVQRWGIGLQAAALPVGWFGQRKVTRAEEAMSRAVWWYNRDVARGEDGRYR